MLKQGDFMKLRTLSLCAIFTAVALIIFRVEAAIPMQIPLYGVKLGLANIVTLSAFYFLKKRWVLSILILRIVMGGILIGAPSTIIYSLAGGILCFLLTALLIEKLPLEQTWVLGILGALAHNAGQLFVAVLFTRSFGILAYAPVLVIAGIITGFITGNLVELFIRRLSKISDIKKMFIIKKGLLE